MTIRGTEFAGLFMAIAAIVVFALLTLLPWEIAIGLVLLGIAAVFLDVHLKGERHRRKVAKAESRAELQRDLIRADREREAALRWSMVAIHLEDTIRAGIKARDGVLLLPDDARLLMSDRGRLDADDAKRRDDLIYRLHALKRAA